MRRSALRYALLIALLLLGIAAAIFTWDTYRRYDVSLTAQRDVDSRLDQLLEVAGEISAAQHAAIIPGQAASWTERTPALFQRLHDDVTAIRRTVQTVEGMAAMQSFVLALDALVDTDARTREYLRMGQELMAADLMFSEGRERLNAMLAGLRTVRSAERRHMTEFSTDAVQRAAMVVGGTAGIWVLGMLLLVRVPRTPRSDVPAPQLTISEAIRQMETPHPPAAPHTSVDLEGAAAACVELARLTDAESLPSVLARTAASLDATGVIVWMGAGEELFATAAHGYDRRILSRLGPIGRAAANATAAAWRDAEIRTVSGDRTSGGAVVAPIVGPSGCVGVFSVELKSGLEIDASTKAVAAMFAAQLGGVLQAWPGHSTSAPAPPRNSATA